MIAVPPPPPPPSFESSDTNQTFASLLHLIEPPSAVVSIPPVKAYRLLFAPALGESGSPHTVPGPVVGSPSQSSTWGSAHNCVPSLSALTWTSFSSVVHVLAITAFLISNSVGPYGSAPVLGIYVISRPAPLGPVLSHVTSTPSGSGTPFS